MEEWPVGNLVDTDSTPLFTAVKRGNIRFMLKNPNNEIFRKWWHWIWFATSSGFITSQHPAMAYLVQQASLNGCCFREVLCRSSSFTYCVSLYRNQRDCWWERIYWHNRKCRHATARFRLVVKRIVWADWEHFTSRAMGFLGCISDSNRDITLKIYTSHFLRMLYKRRVFDWQRSLSRRRWITKGTLLEVHSKFSTVSRFPSQGYWHKFIPRTFRACATDGAIWLQSVSN